MRQSKEIKNNKNDKIKVADLRIGDYIQIDNGIGRVVSLTTFDYIETKEQPIQTVIVGDHLFDCLESEFRSIPLTEEWLLKCPIFHKSHNEYGNTYHILKDEFEVRYTIEHWIKTENPKYKGRFHWVGIGEIKFFHQLQNLYFALTSEELEVKI